LRFAGCLAAAIVAGVTLMSSAAEAAKCGSGPAGFPAWLQDFKAEAAAQGISSRTVHWALDKVTYERNVPANAGFVIVWRLRRRFCTMKLHTCLIPRCHGR
jgi:membrane-bound lytic murein transglycosylase B